MKHPPVTDLNLRNGVNGIGSPSDYHAAQAAVEDATARVIKSQLKIIDELRAELASLRAIPR